MQVSSANATQAAVRAVQGSDDKRMALQMMILKKTLEAQKTEATQAANQLQGKGTVLDIRI